MQSAQTIPLRRVRREIRLRFFIASAANGVEPLEIALQDWIRPRNKIAELLDQRPALPRLAQAIEDPRAFTNALDESGITHQLEVTADARLALPQNLGDL